ncbi:phage tail assembly chaperone [Brevundimonas sp. BH3]|uniref:phage tail assembly chaperone n=1 Tax=Brevundimonas sp. BH3 TaxID=3133089 RepID=UPI0032516DE5
MTQFAFSPSTRAFYDPASWPHDLPSDIVLLGTGDHARLLGELSEGRVLDVDSEGYPLTTEPAGPDIEQLAHLARQRRDAGIASVQWLIERHRGELSLQLSTTLNDEDYLLVHQYVQDLRDVPEQDGFPLTIEWPTLPPELLATGA